VCYYNPIANLGGIPVPKILTDEYENCNENGNGNGKLSANGNGHQEEKPDKDRIGKPPGSIYTLGRLKQQFKRHFYFSDDVVIDVVLGLIAGNAFDNDPLWLYLIGPPSVGKTELLLSVQGRPETYFVSQFTAHSLISGYKEPQPASGSGTKKRRKGKKANSASSGSSEQGNAVEGNQEAIGEDEDKHQSTRAPCSEDYSLLPLLNGKTLIIKDFTVIHQLPGDIRLQILSQLRDAYDGFSSRKVGNDHIKSYHSKFNLMAGMTPVIEKDWSLNTLGERFLMLRITVEDRKAHARKALDAVLDGVTRTNQATGESTDVRKILQSAVNDFLDNREWFVPTVETEMRERILDLAEILAVGRTHVYRDKDDNMPCLPQAEIASRVAKQLVRVGMGVALVRGRRKVTEDEFAVMKRVALDSLPSNRLMLLRAMWEDKDKVGRMLEHFTAKISGLSKSAVRRELENLCELGVATRSSVGAIVFYRLSKEFASYFGNVGGICS
jgi:hypothetical protein